MQILDGMFQLKVPIPNSPVGYVLPYAFQVPGGISIIDPGWDAPESVESLEGQLKAIGASFTDLKQIIVTHVHPDHYGMAHRLRELSGAQVLVHEDDVGYPRWGAGVDIDAWFARHGFPDSAPRMDPNRQGWQQRMPSQRGPDRLMHDGETLKVGAFELRVIWTPGHSPGHACFYMERELLLLSGDHVLPTISPNVGLWPGSDADPLGDYIRSLKLLRGLECKHVYPAHEYDFADLEARLDELEQHHEERLGEVIAAMTAGATTCYEIARGVKWSIGHFDKFDWGTRRAAMSETLSHLRHLYREGRVSLREVDNIDHWTPTGRSIDS
jgi:glyoxylase-like metal-dependent hydrolase (beta-lactamase superfamily II)